MSQPNRYRHLRFETLEERRVFSVMPDLLLDINPTAAVASNPQNFANVNGTIFFTADDGTHGRELWKTDGTTAGTVMVKDIRVGSYQSNPTALTNFNGTLFFSALDEFNNGYQLWKSDGTASGTVMVNDLSQVKFTQRPKYLTPMNGELFFSASGRFWKTDGTAAGTVPLFDLSLIGPHGGANPKFLTNVNGTLFYSSDSEFSSNTSDLWKSDGTLEGTQLVRSFSNGNSFRNVMSLINVSGQLYFSAYDEGLFAMSVWKSDGTTEGTMVLSDLRAGFAGYNPYFTNVNGTLYFAGGDFIHGSELWKTEGTASSTILVKDLNTEPGQFGQNKSSYPTGLANVNGVLFFGAYDGTTGGLTRGLWKSDGNDSGTVLVKSFLATGLSKTHSAMNANGIYFFSAFETDHGSELWQSDGSSAGTQLIRDIKLGTGSSNPMYFANVNGTVYFTADDGIHGRELWKYGPIPSISAELSNGNLTITDQAGNVNNLTISLNGTELVISDVKEQFISAPSGGTLSNNDKTLTIPFATITDSISINTGAGDDVVHVDSTNDTVPISSGGLTIHLGSGNDTLAMEQSTTDNVWSVDGPQNGTVKIGYTDGITLGIFNFTGMENALGGKGKDSFKLKYAGANGIKSLNGGEPTNLLDKLEIARGGKFVLTDSQLTFTPSAASIIAGQASQKFQLLNIKRADLTGTTGNDTFDVSGWTQHGENTDLNRYGGLILAGGGTDKLIKKADLTSATLDDGDLQTSDGMYLRLAGNIQVTLQDTSAASPVSIDISGRTKPANLIANNNVTDAITFRSFAYQVVLNDTYLSSYNDGNFKQGQGRINLTGFNQSNIVTTQNAKQQVWFQNLAWTGTQTLDGTLGVNQLIVSADVANMTIKPNLLQLSSGYKVQLKQVESFKFKAFSPTLGPNGSHDNTFNLSDWLGVGIIEAGAGNDQLIINHSRTTTPQAFRFTPTAAVINDKVIQLVKPDPRPIHLKITGGSANDTITLDNWRGSAAIEGGDGEDTLTMQRDRDMDLNAHQVVIKKQIGSTVEVDKNITYNHIERLGLAAGSGNNTFTLNAGYDADLAADSSGLVLRGTIGRDTLKIKVFESVKVTSDEKLTNIMISSRTLTFFNFDAPEAIEYEPISILQKKKA